MLHFFTGFENQFLCVCLQIKYRSVAGLN